MDEHDVYEGLPENMPLLTNMMAGGLAGIAEHCAMYPVDFVKTRMQILGQGYRYRSSMEVVKLVMREGRLGLWRGVGSLLMGSGPAHALYFSVYERVKRELSPYVNPVVGIGVSGACASMASDVVMNPFDVVKQRMQSQPQYRSVFQCLSRVYRQEGFGAFYVSYPTTISLNVPFHMIHFLTYEFCSKHLNPKKEYSPLMHIVSGGCAGAVGSSMTAPLDVVKTLLQTRGNSVDLQIRNARGMMDGFRIVYGREGIRGFFRGFGPRVLIHIPSTAICWTTYESFRYFFVQSGK